MSRPFTMDEDGQPAPVAINANLRSARTVDEVLGFVKGILADDALQESEVLALAKWLYANAETDEWPVGPLVHRINRVIADGRIDPEEVAELHGFFSQMVGQRPAEVFGRNSSTTLPFTTPLPNIVIPSRIFVFTGKFLFGTRAVCQNVIRRAGGITEDHVTQRTHYLVIGEIGSRDWAHTTHGRKIEQAVECARRKLPIAIVSEQYWLTQLGLAG